MMAQCHKQNIKLFLLTFEFYQQIPNSDNMFNFMFNLNQTIISLMSELPTLAKTVTVRVESLLLVSVGQELGECVAPPLAVNR